MYEVQRINNVLKFLVLTGDLIILNSLLGIFEYFQGAFGSTTSLIQGMVVLSLCYLIRNIQSGVILHRSVVRYWQIAKRLSQNMLVFIFISLCILPIFHFKFFDWPFALYYVALWLVLIIYRFAFRRVLEISRNKRRGRRVVVFLGGHKNMQELYHLMMDDPISDYFVMGYFEDEPTKSFPETVNYLGQPKDVTSFLKKHMGVVDQLYCSYPSTRSDEIMPIINYCENHLIRFFSVPNVRDYFKQRMHFELLGNVPVLSIRREPLELRENRLFKRLFDVVFSSLFLCTIFPIVYIIVGIAIKISSPGPIFFKQLRSGSNGKEFTCYKFRSMRMNVECDKIQATKNDPRKTFVGEFIRKTNIDEFPQFINVLLGNMSIVGPRPHMLKHTEEYSQLINKYMVRHFVKPGITGWAQVTGYRGETKELEQMRGRILRDIWYIEHWSFSLDLYIIGKTIYNILQGEKKAY